ncbi:hypothetical protein [Azospirillum brasilense]|uniref:hypothetical protein n=1 Tax=Azospirillum brasilense TaxID=192 RepID=UPI0003A13912|nr:hypothetical protein [Azospirillum brasilense]
MTAINRRIAELPGPILLVQAATPEALAAGRGEGYDLDLLLNERSVSVNTAAAGGNASLVAMS